MINQQKSKTKGWTFVEMLVAVALSSVVLGAGALALQSISANAKRATSLLEVNIGPAAQDFYGNASNLIRTYVAPNYGELMFTQQIRNRMIEDINSSSAIFCLPRLDRNQARPNTLALSERPNLDSPDRFRDLLISEFPTAAAVYPDNFRTETSTATPNITIYMLGQATVSDRINVNAIYEIDYVVPQDGYNGIYASVRRYVGNDLTSFYDIVYSNENGATSFPLNPSFVTFEQEQRALVNEGANLQQFKRAQKSPFYLVWLPDPTINPYNIPVKTPPLSPAYKNLEGLSSFVVTIPMFPSL